MDTIETAFALAVDHHQHGRLQDAAGIYRLIIEVVPSHPAALNNLGLIAPPDEAVGLLQRAVAAAPDYVDALVNLSSALQASGACTEAAAAYDRAVALIPAEPSSLFRLAHVLQTQGRTADAAAQYERAIDLDPHFAAALCNLGTLHNQAERTREAADCYRRALAQDPRLEVANLNMVSILEAEGRLHEAKQCRENLPRPHPIDTTRAPEHRRTVLVLGNACAGNIPLDTILPARTTTRLSWHVDFATEAQARSLPPYDVAFNVVGNADLLGEAYGTLSRFAARHPILNHPDAVARTRRDRLPAVLEGIPNLVVPRTLRLTRAQAGSPALVADLEAAGMTYPVLVRSIAGHGGEGTQLVHTPEQMAGFALGEADAYYFIAFHDARLADGLYRKYRMVFVEGKAYPYHLAISDHWLVHYFSASMMSAPWKRQEERCFLEAPEAVLGTGAMAAIDAIGRRLGLDFAASTSPCCQTAACCCSKPTRPCWSICATASRTSHTSTRSFPRSSQRSTRCWTATQTRRKHFDPRACLPDPIALNRALGCARSSIG